MGKSLGFNIAAGMMQGLGAGIIENAKAKREEALRAMEIAARQQEGMADRAHRESLSAKELTSAERRHTEEVGMRGKESEARLAEAKAQREQTTAYQNRSLEIDSEYKKGMVANSTTRAENARDPSKMTPAQMISAINDTVKSRNESKLNPKEHVTPAQVALEMFGDEPAIVKIYGPKTDSSGRPEAAAAPASSAAPAAGAKASTTPPAIELLSKNKAESDRLVAEFNAKKYPDETAKQAAKADLIRRLKELAK